MVFVGYNSVFFQGRVNRVLSEACKFADSGRWKDTVQEVTYGEHTENVKIVAPYEAIEWDG